MRWKKATRKTLLQAACAVALVLLTHPAGAGAGQEVTSQGKPELVAETTAQVNKSARRLTLWRQEMPPVDPLEVLRNPSSFEGLGNLAFLLADTQVSSKTPQDLIWVTYVTRSRGIQPRESWLADVAWHPQHEKAYVVVVRSISWNVTLQLFEVDPTVKRGPFPPRFEPEQPKEWPRPDRPVAQATRTLLGRDICGLVAIEVVVEDDHLVLRGERDDKNCPPASFRFDLDKKEWSEAMLESKEDKE